MSDTIDKIPFNDLKSLHMQLADELAQAAQRVLESGWYILGPEVEAFEAAFAQYQGVGHAVGVANGTDAIELALRAAGIGAGDEVITSAHTALATAYAVERAGAVPIFADIDPHTYTIDPASVEAAITPRTKAILPVHLYGQPADMPALMDIATRHDVLLIEDCAQAHGARLNGQLVGSFGHMAAFSFYPTKNLGAYGDGGAVITSDPHYAQRLRRLRNYGQVSRYISEEYGINSRLDEMQAAILQVKLRHLDAHNHQRRELACEYEGALADAAVQPPITAPGVYHVYHLYVVRHIQRDLLMQAMSEQGIGTLIHYPVPVHLQKPYVQRGYRAGMLPHTEQAAQEIFSLPMYIGLSAAHVARVAAVLGMSVKAITS